MFTVTTQRPEDSDRIEALLDAVFGPNRGRKTSYRYREGLLPDPYLSLVARDGDETVGTIRYWPIAIGEAREPALLLGPLATAPKRRGEGIGAALINQSLEMATWANHRLVVLVGDPDYYGRFGFQSAAGHGIHMPGENPARVQIRELVAGALDDASGAVRHWRRVRRRVARRAA